MKICRFLKAGKTECIGLLRDDATVVELAEGGADVLLSILDRAASQKATGPGLPVSSVKLLAPVGAQEIWAAGVTYLRSKKARMEESDFSATAYDKVYEAPRPEIFFKSMPAKVVGPGEPVGIRRDAKWNVPEPELALVLNSRAEITGYTICNDMSSRDIEGENLLYLPQAKIYSRSCAIGPVIRIGATEEEARQWTIDIRISRGSEVVFRNETSVGQIKRRFDELVGYLFRSQEFPQGVILSTGTGIIPPDDFTLRVGDVIRIDISGIGALENPVVEV